MSIIKDLNFPLLKFLREILFSIPLFLVAEDELFFVCIFPDKFNLWALPITAFLVTPPSI